MLPLDVIEELSVTVRWAAFPTTIARDYLARGPGYTTSLARQYFVTPRTVVSWVEKARARGILSAAPGSGTVGGHLQKKSTKRRKG